jgi:CRISPR/Cas system CSM-associated protein Csm4 (group 5 of RAMP superfamily)
MDISGRAGFQIVCEVVKEIMGEKIKMRSINYIFHDITYLHYISCSISTKNMLEDLEKKSKNINSLFYMIVNSIVVPRKNNDIIELKGSEHQKIIDVKIGGTKFEFIFDTGASISLISKNVINNLLENGIITKRNFLEKKYIVTADGKNHLVELWNLPNIVIDGKKINDINFAVMEGNIQPLLGMNIINKLNIYKIDLDDNKIYLKN